MSFMNESILVGFAELVVHCQPFALHNPRSCRLALSHSHLDNAIIRADI